MFVFTVQEILEISELVYLFVSSSGGKNINAGRATYRERLQLNIFNTVTIGAWSFQHVFHFLETAKKNAEGSFLSHWLSYLPMVIVKEKKKSAHRVIAIINDKS
jgi:hypothetical protein